MFEQGPDSGIVIRRLLDKLRRSATDLAFNFGFFVLFLLFVLCRGFYTQARIFNDPQQHRFKKRAKAGRFQRYSGNLCGVIGVRHGFICGLLGVVSLLS
jgi:hypothetical protein